MRSAHVLSAALAALCFAGSARADGSLWHDVQSRGTLKCGVALAPPHINRDPATGEYSGVFVDVCKDFADVLGVKAQLVDTTWDSMVAGVQSGRWDVALDLNRTPKRALAVLFSDSVWDTQTTFAYRQGDAKVDKAWKSFADMDKPGVVIAVTVGSAQDRLVTDAVKQATILRLPDVDAIRLAMQSGRATFAADDVDSNAIFAAAQGPTMAVLSPEPALGRQGQAIGLPVSASFGDVQALNILIENEKASGQIEARVKKYVGIVAGK